MESIKTVLITGGAGFIGSNVADELVDSGYDVIIVDNLESGNIENINPMAKFYNLNINSMELEKVFVENKIDVIFHFAAQASVSVSTKEPYLDAQENILGTINVLSFAKKYSIKKIIVASTAAVYGVPKYLPVDEEHSTNYLSFYGLSKLTMEKYVQMFGIDYIIFRLANVYGPRQSAHGEAGVVAIFTDKILNNSNVEIHSDGSQTRDFVYVKDVAKICCAVLRKDIKNEIINISTNKAISINQLFEQIAMNLNYTKKPIYTKPRFGDIEHSILDNKKCIKLFGYAPGVNINEGIIRLIEQLKCERK